ncbi:MAG: hypothetical protein KY476_14130 [Planctomycetes bacterium]|nr:hypothetical protein [Planctomycetota bacterium]
MSLYLAAALLTATPADVASFTSMDLAAQSLAADVRTGTLLFSNGDCAAVKVYTQSPYTHVAAVVVEDGKAFVYDSMNGVGVRRLSLEEYLAAECPNRIHVYQPRRPFNGRRGAAFVEHLQSQLGRPYALAHHVTGERADGLHCSEYMTDALMSCRLIRANQPPRVSPASLLEGLLRAKLYEPDATLVLKEPEQPRREGRCWCEQLWFDTVDCTSRFCERVGRVVLCR